LKHLGDITQINGAEIEPVECITFGSPCQDLSVAGKRKGLEGERSGLFAEAVRVISEMRREDIKRGRTGEFIRPRYAIWENVPGAFSSNRGAISESYWKCLQESKSQKLLFLDLTKSKNGQNRVVLSLMNGLLHGELWMLNFGESPSEERESHLSQILQDKVLQKYYLSKRACEGILRRAKERGKELPEILKQALMNVVRLNEVDVTERSSCNQGGIAICQKAYDEWSEDDKGTTLKACGGSYGGQRELSDKCGTILSRDYKGVAGRDFDYTKVVIDER
jgi:hypothetical protein